MSTPRLSIRRLAFLLAALALLAAGCSSGSGSEPDEAGRSDDGESSTTSEASSDDDADDDADDDSDDDADDDADETATSVDTSEETPDAGDSGAFRIGMVAPSSGDDVAFTQSMVDAVNFIGESRDIEFELTPLAFDIEVATAAISGYAEQGFDLVIAHGSQYGEPLQEIAPAHPDVAFAWGTAVDTFDLPNVSSYAVAADQGGYVLGSMAAAMSESGSIGVIGPIEVGDAAAYIDGFANGATAQDAAVRVDVTYIGSFSDVILAGQTAQGFVDGGADVLTGSAQMVAGATTVAAENEIPWFGNQANQTSLAPEVAVASQVYHWEIVLEQVLAGIDAGELGGESYMLDLANGGIVIEYNDAASVPADIRAIGDATTAGIIDGSIDTGV